MSNLRCKGMGHEHTIGAFQAKFHDQAVAQIILQGFEELKLDAQGDDIHKARERTHVVSSYGLRPG